MFGIEVAEVNVARRVAVVNALLSLLFDLFDNFDHNQCHIHVSLLLVTVLGFDELTKGHLGAVVGRKALVFT
jgi:hypothetical protein